MIAVAAAATAAVFLIGAAILSRGGGGESVQGPVVVPSPRPTDQPREGHLLGGPNAAVTIVEYADFQ